MPAKRVKKEPKSTKEEEVSSKPQPPNIFLYVQLARILQLPPTAQPLEIHITQGDNVIVKCVDHYNTDGIITQDEFNEKPTFTLIFQQDNLDRINDAVDNPLLIKLYMRRTQSNVISDEEQVEEEEKEKEEEEEVITPPLRTSEIDSENLEKDKSDNSFTDMDGLTLLNVGYLDLIKLFGHTRCMIREKLFLYPIQNVPCKLRSTIHTEWDLYTLVPIAKDVIFSNMAFVIFESIYNVKDEHNVQVKSLYAQLSFRSLKPTARNEYHVIPWCSFTKFTENVIAYQHNYHQFESFRKSLITSSYCAGLKSNMEVHMHKLFSQLMRSENMDVNFHGIDREFDLALTCNTFHRYILTRNMSEDLFSAFVGRRYVIQVEIWQETEQVPQKTAKGGNKKRVSNRQKVYEGTLDPAVLLFPGVQSIRFAVELKPLGMNRKSSRQKPTEEPTFAIIKICLFVPLGETYHELQVFRDSFVGQNRLLNCNPVQAASTNWSLGDIRKDIYSRFDEFIRDAIGFVVQRNYTCVEDKPEKFCCLLQNLSNILLKVIGYDFNIRIPTKNNEEFRNLCAVAFNELEQRIHNILEKMEDEGFDEIRNKQTEITIESMNAIKIMKMVGDKVMADFYYEKEFSNGHHFFQFYDLISKMERGDYDEARKFFKTPKNQPNSEEYRAGWINIYLKYLEMRDNEDDSISANANESILNTILKYAQKHERHLDGWVLLYCYYKRFNYTPGYTYARWRLEDQSAYKPQTSGKEFQAPFSLWGISLNVFPKFHSVRGHIFFSTFKAFVRLGLYEFGEVVFAEVQMECTEMERYFITTQLKLLLHQLPEDFQCKEISEEGEEETEQPTDAFLAQLNGSVEYQRGNLEQAAYHYERNLHVIQADNAGRDTLLLSKVRLAYIAFGMGNYQLANNALKQCNRGPKTLTLACTYLRGKAYYKLHKLNKAIDCFSICTTFSLHLPNAWGFLALINLRLGHNLNAINCWKYARVDPTKSITDEIIFEELDAIDVDAIDLFVDLPSTQLSQLSNEESEDD